MRKHSVIAPATWDEYANLQSMADRRRRVDCRSWGLEEQMDCCLNSMSVSVTVVNASERRSFANLEANRAKKFRRRMVLLREKIARLHSAETTCSKLRKLCDKETYSLVCAAVTSEELAVFQQLADGTDYATLAAQQHISLAALKSQIHRCRERIRLIAQ